MFLSFLLTSISNRPKISSLARTPDEIKASVITVNFEANGAIGMMFPMKCLPGEKIKLPILKFIGENLQFSGWATSSKGDVVYKDNQEITLGNEDLTLYAIWYDPTKVVSVTFYSSGGEGSMAPLYNVPEGSDYDLPKCTFTKKGYAFIGWSVEENSQKKEYQDQGRIQYYKTQNSKLYAIWAEESKVIKISFDANKGTGTLDPIYAIPNEMVIIPNNNFYPPEEGYVTNGYGKLPDIYLEYRPSGQYAFTESITLYAFWSPAGPEVGGNIDEFKGQTVWVDGLQILDSDWKQMQYSKGVGAAWRQGCGWYDCYQSWWNLCWAASTSNAIHWWFDRNRAYINKWNKYAGPALSYTEKGYSSIFEFFSQRWPNEGNNIFIGFNWFMINFQDQFIPDTAKGYGAYFKDIFGSNSLVNKITGFGRRTFNIFIAEALKSRKLISFSENGFAGPHAITLWGVHFDDNGYIDRFYYSDSATDADNYGKNLNIGIASIEIVYDVEAKYAPYMRTDMGGKVDILNMFSIDQGTQYWETFFAEHPEYN